MSENFIFVIKRFIPDFSRLPTGLIRLLCFMNDTTKNDRLVWVKVLTSKNTCHSRKWLLDGCKL